MSAAHFVIDRAYQERVTSILMEALMVGLKDPATSVAIWRVGEMVDAMTDLQAMLIAGSDIAKSAPRVRSLVEEHRKRLLRKTLAFRVEFDTNGSPFPTYTVEGDFH